MQWSAHCVVTRFCTWWSTAHATFFFGMKFSRNFQIHALDGKAQNR